MTVYEQNELQVSGPRRPSVRNVQFQDTSSSLSNLRANVGVKFRRNRISPVRKDVMRAKLLKFCVDKANKSRSEYITRLRDGRATSSVLAREILDESLASNSDSLLDYRSNFDDDIDDELELGQDLYQEIMAEIYESICSEISEDLDIAIFDEGAHDDIDWALMEDLDVPVEQILMCPLCKIHAVEADFSTNLCNCRCGSSFSFSNRRHEIENVSDFRDLFSGVYDRYKCSILYDEIDITDF